MALGVLGENEVSHRTDKVTRRCSQMWEKSLPEIDNNYTLSCSAIKPLQELHHSQDLLIKKLIHFSTVLYLTSCTAQLLCATEIN